MKIETLMVGPIMENCYIAYDETTLEGVIIDPGDDYQDIMEAVAELQLKIKYIINTHGHADHIGANKELVAKLNAQLAIHQADQPMLVDPKLNLSHNGYMGRPIISPEANLILKEGDILQFGKESLQVIHTPGHTPGGICLLGNKVLFSGDTLFAGSIGRTDFPNGSLDDLITNIKTKLLILDPKTIVYPGHGSPTTIGYEISCNPFLA